MTDETNTHEEPEADPIEAILAGECLSVSGRSTLTYEVGRHTQDNTLHLRIADNSGKGMFCKDWVAATEIDAICKAGGIVAVQVGHRHTKCLGQQPRRLHGRLMHTQLIATNPSPTAGLVDADRNPYFFLR